VLLLFDGLDELSSKDVKYKIEERIREFGGKFSPGGIIVTSRSQMKDSKHI